MLIWGFLLALPVAFAMLILWGICRRVATHHHAFNTGVLVGGIFLYFGTVFFLNVPPPYILDYLLQHEPFTMQLLHHVGLRSTVQDPCYFSDMLRTLGWVFVGGWVVGAGATWLNKSHPFEPYASEENEKLREVDSE